MSEVRLVVQDQQGAKWGDFHGSTVSRVVAALAAEPEAIDELAIALERFEYQGKRLLHRGLHCGFRDDPWDSGIVLIDLPGRLLIAESSYDHFQHSSSVCYHNGSSATNLSIRYLLPADWSIENSVDLWSMYVDRRQQRQLALDRKSREFVYGDCMLDFFVKRCYQSAELRKWVELENAGQTFELCKQFHIEWLLTQQEALGDQSPRAYMLDGLEAVDADLWSRQEQWSLSGHCPPSLPADCFAQQNAPFGSQEFYLYNYMLEYVLECCVVRLSVSLKQGENLGKLDVERDELRRLVTHWLNQPQDDFRGRSAAQIIQMERQRIPLALSREDTIIDCDCPLCNLMADLPGPAFWGLDGSGLPLEFPFTTFRSEEEWNSLMLEDNLSELPLEQDMQIQLGSGIPGSGNALAATMVAPNTALMALVSVGFSLSDLVMKLGEIDPSRQMIHALNRHFDNVRAVVLEHGENLCMIEPVLERFEDTLHDLKEAHPELVIDCDEVSTMLATLLDFAD